MIISPPFIPAPVAHESDEAFIDRAMQGGSPGDGAFPVSGALNWHGGIHLTAPREGDAALPVRAIADGKLVYFRAPTPKSDDPKHPLNYSGAWTDNGCIVIRHETEIGEGENAQVTYFSIYMHLSKLNLAAPHLGQSIYRKDNLGEAGSIYGSEGRIHFEIIADQSQIARLVGRTTQELDYQSGNGRTDSCWGDMYFFVPPEALGYAQAPSNLARVANSSAVVYRRPTLPQGTGIAIVAPDVDGYQWTIASRLQRGMVVRMHYEKGQCQLTSYYLTGDLIGTQAEAHDFEYDLYTTATKRYPQCPSAGYELLRFGRILGPDSLRADDSAHWRQIKVPGRAGQESPSVWFDLNGPGITKFSDADFPHWQGWHLVDDDADSDSHCQSPYIRQQLELNSGSLLASTRDAVAIANSPQFATLSAAEQRDLSKRYMDERELNMSRLARPETQQRLKRLICTFPTEWSANDFDTRYGWLLKVAEGGPMSQLDYDELKQHQRAMAFWESAGLEGIGSMHWHFPPKDFIAVFRKCGWLSRNELVQLLPSNSLRKAGVQWFWEDVSLGNASRLLDENSEDAKKRRLLLNKSLRKFLIISPIRLACFFGNATQETQWYQKFHEASSYWYAPWDGRGFLQLTHAANYIKYWEFQGVTVDEPVRQALSAHSVQANNNRPIVDGHKSMQDPTHSLSDTSTGIPQEIIRRRNSTSEAVNAAYSAGAYWAWSGAAAQADANNSSVVSTLRVVQTNKGIKHYYENSIFGNVAATINIGRPSTNYSAIWGVQARFMAFSNAQVILLESVKFSHSDGSVNELPQSYVRRGV